MIVIEWKRLLMLAAIVAFFGGCETEGQARWRKRGQLTRDLEVACATRVVWIKGDMAPEDITLLRACVKNSLKLLRENERQYVEESLQ